MAAFTRETKTEAYVIWDRYLAFYAHLNLVVVHRLVDSGGVGVWRIRIYIFATSFCYRISRSMTWGISYFHIRVSVPDPYPYP